MAGYCIHWWLIKFPDGPTSRGVCKWCGEVREFANSFKLKAPGLCSLGAQSRGGGRGKPKKRRAAASTG